ncbi:hypothetical protein F4604DRAFT_1935488 [Suillus subluteus]|nr:hypothetical protein F4604DRAFT_1935488 [Suillus subluteus]
MPRDSPPRIPHPSGHRSPSPDELLLISPESRPRRLLTPITPITQDPSSPAVQSRDRLPLPPPPPVPPSPPLVIPEDPEPVSRYSLRRRGARQLQPHAFDKARCKAQMKANPDAIVKFVSPQRREMHGEDGSQWADGQTQGETQAERKEAKKNKRVTIAEVDHDNREREEGWLPEALRDLSESDEIEGTGEVRKLVREAKRARKKAEAEAKKREKEEARLRAQDEADAKETAKKKRSKNFPLEASSSKQPAAGPSSASSRRSPFRLDEWSPPVLSRLSKGKQRATPSPSRSPSPSLSLHVRPSQLKSRSPARNSPLTNINKMTITTTIISSTTTTTTRSMRRMSTLIPTTMQLKFPRHHRHHHALLEQQGSQAKILASTKRVHPPTPSDSGDEPLRPGHARARMGAGGRDVVIQGDPESSDVEIPRDNDMDVDAEVPDIV